MVLICRDILTLRLRVEAEPEVAYRFVVVGLPCYSPADPGTEHRQGDSTTASGRSFKRPVAWLKAPHPKLMSTVAAALANFVLTCSSSRWQCQVSGQRLGCGHQAAGVLGVAARV